MDGYYPHDADDNLMCSDTVPVQIPSRGPFQSHSLTLSYCEASKKSVNQVPLHMQLLCHLCIAKKDFVCTDLIW